MKNDGSLPYCPINVLKPVCPNVWIVDGPIVRFGVPWLRFPFPTRMTIVRLAGDALFIHSPTALPDDLVRAISDIGTPNWIVAPNRLHHTWIGDWHAAYPRASVFLAPGIGAITRGNADFPHLPLDQTEGYPWDAVIDTLPVSGRFMTEVEFFHRPSRTLILTDLIENFEVERLHTFFLRLLTRLGAVLDPHGAMPRDMRMTFKKSQLRQAVEAMLQRHPERIILSHGRWYPFNGEAELRRAFRWLLK